MKILLTNDDGIDSPGLKALEVALADHQLCVAAPESQRSGYSHSITLAKPVRFKERGDNRYSVSGTPADCVLYTLLGAIEFKPDLIISGINLGPNLGTDLVYSGTAAAARQGALSGIPSVAVSMASESFEQGFDQAAEFVARHVESWCSMAGEDYFLNINFPKILSGSPEVLVTHPSRRVYNDSVVPFAAPDGSRYFFLSGSSIEAKPQEGSDWDAVSRGHISLSAIYLHPVRQDQTDWDQLITQIEI